MQIPIGRDVESHTYKSENIESETEEQTQTIS